MLPSACAAKPAGERFLVRSRRLGVRVEAWQSLASDAVYEVRPDPPGACVARVAATFPPRWTPASGAWASNGTKRPLAYGLLRADFSRAAPTAASEAGRGGSSG